MSTEPAEVIGAEEIMNEWEWESPEAEEQYGKATWNPEGVSPMRNSGALVRAKEVDACTYARRINLLLAASALVIGLATFAFT